MGSPSHHGSARTVSIAGFANVALFVVSLLFGPGQELVAPGLSAERLASLHQEHRAAILGGVYVANLTWGGVFLVFAGALAAYLASVGSGTATFPLVGLAGAVLEAAAILLFCAFSHAAAFVAGAVEPDFVLVLHQGALLANNLSGIPTIVCVGAFTLGGRRSGAFPGWVVALAAVCILLHAVSSISLAAVGWFAPSGPASLLAPFTMAFWVLGVSVALLRGVRT